MSAILLQYVPLPSIDWPILSGSQEGDRVGLKVGDRVGLKLGDTVGSDVGFVVGSAVVGDALGDILGDIVGDLEMQRPHLMGHDALLIPIQKAPSAKLQKPGSGKSPQ